MRAALRRILRIGAVAAGVLVLILAAAILLVLVDKPLVRNIVRDQLAKRTGMTVGIGKLDYALFPLRVTASSLQISRENAYYRLTASVARLEAGGDARKLVRGQKPALETIQVDGLFVRVEEKAASPEPLDLKALVAQASDALAWTRHLALTNARLSVALTSQEAEIEDLDIALAPQGRDGSVAYSIGPCTIDIKDKGRAAGLRGILSSSGTLRTASSPSFAGMISLGSPRITAPGIDEAFDGAIIELEGRFDLAPGEFAVTRAKMAFPGLLDLDATGRGKFSQGVSMEAEVNARIEKLEDLAARFGPRFPPELRGIRLQGKAELVAKSHFSSSSGASKSSISGTASFNGVRAEFRGTRLRGNARLTGRYDLARSTKAPLSEKSPPTPLLKRGVSEPSEISPPSGNGGRGMIVSAMEKGGGGDFLDGALAFDKVEVDRIFAGEPLHLEVSGLLRATGTSHDPRLSIDLRSNSGKTTLDKLSVGGTEIRLAGTATKSAADISRFDVALKGVDIDSFPGKRIAFDRLTLAGKGRLDIARKAASVDALISGIPDIAPLALRGRIGTGPPPAAELRLEGKGLGLPAVRALASPFIPESLTGWDVGGTADLTLEARHPDPALGPEGWRFSGAVCLAQAKFNDPSFTIAGEGLGPALKFEGSWVTATGISFTGGLEIGSGESLWKTVYVSWGKHPLKATFSGRYDPRSGGVDGLEARFLFPTIGQIDVSGSLHARPSPAFTLKIDSRLSLGPLYSLTGQAGSAQASRMSVGGTLGASILARKTDSALSVEGRLTIAEAAVGFPTSGTELTGVSADIPIRYLSAASGTAPPEGPLSEAGFLRIGEFRNPVLTLKPVAVSLRAGTNAFAVEPLPLELFGGRLELGRTEFRMDPRTGAVRGAGSLALRELDISKFPIPPQFKLTGRVRADFPRLDISSREIAVSGRGEADIFGGKVVLRDLSVADPFTPGRAISLNVDLVDLDLKKLTDEIPFGEVTGIVRGDIRGLVLSYGQPARFDFRIESVPRRGFPQTFSLKAVDNLTVLSSGQQASAGTGPFWMRFVRGFRYRKLGIVSTLRNDTFTLNGTIHEGGVEYLVKKPPLFGINVVNRMPDKKISFKEMTGRLKRVGQSEK